MALDVLEAAFFQKMNPIALLLLLLAVLFTAPWTQADPIRPKVIILTAFEIGADAGDRPDELQCWVERERCLGHLTFQKMYP